jgi:hypothetical protein
MDFHLIQTVHAASIIPDFSTATDFGYFIRNVYLLSIGIVGIAVFVQFIRAGLEYMLAAGNIGKVENAKEYMTNAVLGAVLLLSSYLILNVINSDLLDINMFNKTYLTEQLKKDLKIPPPLTPKCEIDPASCRDTKNDNEKQLQELGVDWGTSDVSNINKETLLVVGDLRANCSCPLTMGGFEHAAGGDVFNVSPAPDVYGHLLATASKVRQENSLVGDTPVIVKTWKDSRGTIYETTELADPQPEEMYLNRHVKTVVVRVPA